MTDLGLVSIIHRPYQAVSHETPHCWRLVFERFQMYSLIEWGGVHYLVRQEVILLTTVTEDFRYYSQF
jgi:hypothetical protein